ncbi:hypothetical protein VNI00_012175 [Paramarasmius palmivorus]|uniref:Cytochrome P450 n=1 Tax=Paramarasmius palmivorus TaxID=297713 RepID=A0AAW0C6M7_9AGAR
MLSLLFLGVIAGCLYFLNRSRSRNHPPGPKPHILFGNIFDFPASSDLVSRAQQWKEDYGSIVHLSALGRHIVVLNDVATSVELLEKRGYNYADRPHFPMVGELCGFDRLPAIASNGFSPRLRALRKLLKTEVGAERLADWEENMEVEVATYVKKLQQEPEDFVRHNRWFAVDVIMLFSYGYRVALKDDYHMAAADRIMSKLSRDAQPGTWLVDLIPAMKHFPRWMPFHRYASQSRKELDDWVTEPWKLVKSRQTTLPSLCTRLMDQCPDLTPEEEDLIVWSAASIYSAGSDTTVSALTTFFLAMTMFPSVQRKAHREIAQVIGEELRLPRFSDQPDLPYISALIMEVFRWGAILPMGAPRRASADDLFQSYIIPEGSFVMPNIWGICHDEKVYPRPMEFDPSRFLGANPQPDPRDVIFGFGRRVCPGRYLAEKSLYIAVTATLSAFEISEIEGSPPFYSFDDGFIR